MPDCSIKFDMTKFRLGMFSSEVVVTSHLLGGKLIKRSILFAWSLAVFFCAAIPQVEAASATERGTGSTALEAKTNAIDAASAELRSGCPNGIQTKSVTVQSHGKLPNNAGYYCVVRVEADCK